MKTVYRFYTKPNKEALMNSSDLSVEDKYPLEAFTNDKTIKDEFVKNRNMDKYIMIKSKMDKKEYTIFTNSNRNKLLGFYPLDTYLSKDHHDKKSVNVLATWFEAELVDNYAEECFDNETSIQNIYTTCPLVLNDKYLKALEKLEYINLWKLYGEVERYLYLVSDSNFDEYMDYSTPNVTYDYLNLFIDILGDKFK